MSACPSDEQLQLLVQGSISNLELDPLELHCRECPSCIVRLGEIRGELVLPPTVQEAFAAFHGVPGSAAGALLDGNRGILPDSVPGYQILKEVRRGGQGVIYQAIQRATNRRVAIKVLLAGPFSGPVQRARFEREVQVLAALKHPHVVSIHDSGSVAGNFYFVMDYISGKPLDDYVREEKLGVRDTLVLFAKVCDAVNAAHLHGIIHRDLKPENVRVNAGGEPHVLDFGMARVALGGVTGEHAPELMTMTGQFVGSPPWASPEQAEGIPGKIDLRTDVYSLGVILYEILTGQLPYDVSGTVWEILERVRRQEPLRPRTLRGDIDDELETIILKCLAKERERRYQSAGELGREVQRYLAGEPIEAKRDSTGYLMRKTLRRHRWAFGVGMLIMALGGIAATVSIVFGYLAVQERNKAEQARQVAEEKTLEAEAAHREADLQTEQALRRLYSRQIALAEQALNGNSAPLRKLLLECPEELRGWEWYWLWRVSDTSEAVLRGHTGAAMSVFFAPDGRTLVSASFDGTIRVWDGADGTPRQVFHTEQEGERCVSYSPTQHRVVLGRPMGRVECWDLAAGQRLWSMDSAMSAFQMAFSPDGGTVAVDGPGRVMEFRDSSTGKMLRTLEGGTKVLSNLRDLAYSQDGRRLAAGLWDGTVAVWDVETGEIRVLQGHEGPVFAVAFSPDGKTIASAGDDATVRIWDAETGQELRALRGHWMAVNTLAFSPDGTRIATGGRDATVRIWDAATGSELKRLRGHEGSVLSVAFSADGNRLASASRDLSVRLWNADGETGERTLLSDTGQCRDVSLSADGRTLAAASVKAVVLWDLERNRELVRFTAGDDRRFGEVSLSPDGRRVAGAGFAEGPPGLAFVKVWDVPRATELWSTTPVEAGGVDARFSPDGRRLLATAEEGTACIHDAETGDIAATLKGHQGGIWTVAFSPDGRRVATAGEDKLVKVWDAGTGQELLTFAKHARPVHFVAFSPDGTTIASCSADNTARLWSSDTGEELIAPLEYSHYIYSLALSPDGRRLATVDNQVRIWDLRSGELLITLSAPPGLSPGLVLYGATFSTDGRQLIACGGYAGGPSVIRIWDVPDFGQRIEE